MLDWMALLNACRLRSKSSFTVRIGSTPPDPGKRQMTCQLVTKPDFLRGFADAWSLAPHCGAPD